MDWTRLIELVKPLGDLVGVLSGLGLVTVLLAFLKHNSERRCWRNFKSAAHNLAGDLLRAGNRHPFYHMEEDDWKAVCERLLSDANFSPIQIQQIIPIAVVVLKGITANRIVEPRTDG